MGASVTEGEGATNPFQGDAGLFEHLVHDLAMYAEVRLLGLTRDWALLDTPRGLLVVARAHPRVPPELAAMMKELAGQEMVVLLVGGSPDSGVPGCAETVHLVRVTEAGGVQAPEGNPRVAWLVGWLAGRLPLPLDWARFWAVWNGTRRAIAHERNGFHRRLLANSPWVTRVLVGGMGALFAVELALGADTDAEIVLQMGALSGEHVASGQVWRLVTATLLHGSAVHAMMNLFVLWRLGDLMERILGSARFLVLYVVAALCGSGLSLLFLDGISIGASGAIWGVMAAQFALSVRGGDILPAPLCKAMRSGAGQNLVLNLLISFVPGIDWAAHVGGGLGGAVAALGLARGLPKWAEVAANARDGAPPWIRGVAGLCGALLGGGAVVILVRSAADVV